MRGRDTIPAILYTASGTLVGAFGLGGYSRPLEGDALMVLSVVVVHVAAVPLAWLICRRQQNGFEKTAILAVLGLLGSIGWGPGVLAIVNASGDASVREQETHVIDFSEHTSRGKTSYYLTFEPWPPLDEPEELQVEAADYARAKAKGKGSPARIRVGHGRLGIEHLPLDWGTPFLVIPP